MPSQLGGAPPCKTCGNRVYFNEQKMFMSRAWHINCFRCSKYFVVVGSRFIHLWKHNTGKQHISLSETFVDLIRHDQDQWPFDVPDDCNKKLESGNANLTEEDTLICNQCKRRLMSPSEEQPPKEEYVNQEDPECCPRCGRRVYFAEQVVTLGRKWHNACFCCGTILLSVQLVAWFII